MTGVLEATGPSDSDFRAWHWGNIYETWERKAIHGTSVFPSMRKERDTDVSAWAVWPENPSRVRVRGGGGEVGGGRF